ncbi:MAG: patatin-like phospholipase family protein [Gammaproteobacteria bacterium]
MSFLDNLLKKTKPKLVLSLDGGGVRVLAGVVFLKKLEIALGKRITDVFDFFIGTSAGGVSALCLACLQMDTEELDEFWSEANISLTMSKSFWDNATIFQTKPKYDGKGKHDVLQKYFKNMLLQDSPKPVAVTGYDVEKRQPRLLTSYTKSNISVAKAGTATSAAPIYYPTEDLEDGSWLIDGGVVANNPSLIGYVEASKLFKTKNIRVLSIGTGINRRKINGKQSSTWGMVSWFRHDILGIMTESSMYHELLTDLIGENYLRVNSATGQVNRRMDDNSGVNLERINLMGLEWWSEFGEQSLELVDL